MKHALDQWKPDVVSCLTRRSAVFALATAWLPPRLFAADDEAPRMKGDEIEAFLRDGKVLNVKNINVGIAGTHRVTLSQGTIVHDAHVQSIDESKAKFETLMGTELNFRDCYKFNIAAYKLDRMLGLNMIPPSIERRWGGKSSAFTWWINGAMMEGDRKKRKLEPPDPDTFNKQMFVVRVFDQLVFNTDRNLQNLLITPDWNIWMIDHTRCFRLRTDLATPKNLVRCDRHLLQKLRELTREQLTTELGDYLRGNEIDGLLARRDRIVQLFQDKIARLGEANVLFDLPPRDAIWPVPPVKMTAR